MNDAWDRCTAVSHLSEVRCELPADHSPATRHQHGVREPGNGITVWGSLTDTRKGSR